MSDATTSTTTTTGGGGVNADETDRLIASDKVEGTAVYNRAGGRLGSVRNVIPPYSYTLSRMAGVTRISQ